MFKNANFVCERVLLYQVLGLESFLKTVYEWTSDFGNDRTFELSRAEVFRKCMFIYANVGQNNVISMPIYIREKSLVSKQFMRTSSKNIAVFIFISWFTKKPLYFGVVIFWIGRKNFIMKKWKLYFISIIFLKSLYINCYSACFVEVLL